MKVDLENGNNNGESSEVGKTPSPTDGKKIILKCYLSLKLLPDKTIMLELSFISAKQKDYMHQVLVFLKNKLVSGQHNGNKEQQSTKEEGKKEATPAQMAEPMQ